jgi:AcrR family transcriptional regulator
MALLQDAAVELLLNNQPETLTVRDIASRARVAYRYIPDYFGGKAELFASIYPRVAQEAASVLGIPFAAAEANFLSPQIIRHARLAIWLSSNHPKGVPLTERPIQRQLEQSLRQHFEIDDATAHLVSELLIAQVLVLAAFPDAITAEPIDLRAHVALELNMLAAYTQR